MESRRPPPRPPRRVLPLLALGAVLLAAGCQRTLLRPFDLDVPPQVLTDAARAGVIDVRARFREIWCGIRADRGSRLPDDRPCEDALVRFEGEGAPTGRPVGITPPSGGLRVVVVPGLVGDCVKATIVPWSDGLAHLSSLGYRTEIVWVSGRSSSTHNARQLREAVTAMSLAPGERLLVLGYSKGAVDMLEALASYPEIVPRVAALVSVGGAINGSPVIEGLLRRFGEVLKYVPDSRCEAGDGGALDSLRPHHRQRWLATAELPSAVQYFSLAGVVDESETSWPMRLRWRRLAALDPRNDGQVIWSDAVIPGSKLLGYLRADHLAMALPFSRNPTSLGGVLLDHNAFPREVMLEAIVRIVEEFLPAPIP